MTGHTSFFLGLLAASVIALGDQLSKWYILYDIMIPPKIIKILPFLDIVLVFNHGISFGLLAQHAQLGVMLLIGMALVIIGVLLYWLWHLQSHYMAIAIGFIIGGAIGNVIDRMRLGSVVDFIHFHWHLYSFPAFNIADAFISIGAGLMILENIVTLIRQKGVQH